MSYTLTPEEFAATKVKVDKLNKRSQAKGWTGRVELVGVPKEKTYKNAIGMEITEKVIETTITGEAPSYENCRFLASVEFLESGAIVRTAPGVESIDRDALEPEKCDHCGIKRYRRKAFVVERDGKQLQVGSTCLKDFLGWDTNPVFVYGDELNKEFESVMGGGFERSYDPSSVLAVAWAVVKARGYVRTSDYSAQPTRDVVISLLLPAKSNRDRELEREFAPLIEQAWSEGPALRDWVLSDEFSGQSEYVQNLKVLCASESVSLRQVGYLASVPQARARAQEKTLIKEREKSELNNEYYPAAIKERITVNVKIKAIRWINTYYGSTCLYTLISDDGYTFKWFASNDVLGDQPTEEFQSLTGTVKDFDEYKGFKSTVITRCKAN